MSITGKSLKNFAVDVLYDAAGSIFYAIGLSCFTAPAKIAPGGVSGISVILNHLFGVPLGLANLAMNIPLLLLAWRFLGKKFTIKTLKTVLIISLVVDLVEYTIPPYTGAPMLAALFGGVGIGVGLAAVFLRGSTTGGSDIVSRLIQQKKPYLPIGRIMMLVDTAVVILSVIVFRDIEVGLYAFITIFTTSRVVDGLLAGATNGRMMLIISDKNVEIARDIMSELGRGVTVLKGQGGYSGAEKNVLMCAARTNEYHKVYEYVRKRDPAAFIISTEATQILGEGFSGLNDDSVT